MCVANGKFQSLNRKCANSAKKPFPSYQEIPKSQASNLPHFIYRPSQPFLFIFNLFSNSLCLLTLFLILIKNQPNIQVLYHFFEFLIKCIHFEFVQPTRIGFQHILLILYGRLTVFVMEFFTFFKRLETKRI